MFGYIVVSCSISFSDYRKRRRYWMKSAKFNIILLHQLYFEFWPIETRYHSCWYFGTVRTKMFTSEEHSHVRMPTVCIVTHWHFKPNTFWHNHVIRTANNSCSFASDHDKRACFIHLLCVRVGGYNLYYWFAHALWLEFALWRKLV